MKMVCRFMGVLLMSLSSVFITSCDKDDDIAKDPEGTITLNMLNEKNGNTLLGTSDVYINESNNFYTPKNFISDAGKMSGVGAKVVPVLSNLTQEVAVTPGHVYQVFEKGSLLDFPSGNRAIQNEAGYYQVYVVSPIASNNATTGAIVKYFMAYSVDKNLPEFGHKIGDFYNIGETVEMAIPKGAECVLVDKNYENVEDVLELSVNGGKMTVTLKLEPNKVSGPLGLYRINIRSGNVYTSVNVSVND